MQQERVLCEWKDRKIFFSTKTTHNNGKNCHLQERDFKIKWGFYSSNGTLNQTIEQVFTATERFTKFSVVASCIQFQEKKFCFKIHKVFYRRSFLLRSALEINWFTETTINILYVKRTGNLKAELQFEMFLGETFHVYKVYRISSTQLMSKVIFTKEKKREKKIMMRLQCGWKNDGTRADWRWKLYKRVAGLSVLMMCFIWNLVKSVA